MEHTPQSSNQIRFDDEKIPVFRAQLVHNNETLYALTELVNTDPVDRLQLTCMKIANRCLVPKIFTQLRIANRKKINNPNGLMTIVVPQNESLNQLETYL